MSGTQHLSVIDYQNNFEHMSENKNFADTSKRVTIEDLGKRINNGFKEAKSDMNQAISGLESRIDSKIDALEDRMDSRFDEVDDQLDSIRLGYATKQEHILLKGRVNKVEAGLKS